MSSPAYLAARWSSCACPDAPSGGISHGDPTRGAVDHTAEPTNLGVAERIDEPLDHAVVQAAHEVGVIGRQLAERAVRKRHDRHVGGVVGVGDDRVETEPVEIVDECFQAGPRVAERSPTISVLNS